MIAKKVPTLVVESNSSNLVQNRQSHVYVHSLLNVYSGLEI